MEIRVSRKMEATGSATTQRWTAEAINDDGERVLYSSAITLEKALNDLRNKTTSILLVLDEFEESRGPRHKGA